MNHSVLAGCKLHECADRNNSYNRTYENVADFGVVSYRQNYRLCSFRVLDRTYGRNITSARIVVVELDFSASLLHNLFDYAALLADNVADFVGVDLKADNLGCVYGELGRNLGNTFEHFG